MNSDDLRDALTNEARQQPAVSPDLRSGVDHRVRRQRLRAVIVVAPAIVLVLVAAVLLAPRTGNDTTVSTADGNNAGSAPVASVPPAVVGDPNQPATSTPGVPAPTDSTSVDCGTVSIGLLPTDAIETERFSCFLKSFNGGGTAHLTIVTTSADGGSLTQRLTSSPGQKVTVEGSGTMSVKLPSFNLGSGGGMDNPFPGASAPASGDCGTISIPVPDLSTIKPGGGGMPGGAGQDRDMGLDMEAMSCLFGAFTGGAESQITVEMTDTSGGRMTMAISISADHLLTMTLDGSMTLQLPAGMQVPEDVLNAIPPGTLGMGQMVPGMGPRTKK